MSRAVHGLTRLAALPIATAALAVPATSPAQGADEAAAVIRAINAQRAANGLSPVKRDGSLAALARAHSTHMVAHQRFSHDGFGKRIRRSAWARRRSSWAAAETLAWGTGRRGTPAGVVAAWMQSPKHRAIVLDPRFHVVGVGQVKGVPVGRARGCNPRTYTADFGS
jgi:uncharacterized protein YkwD